jgi:hypothetical protein
MAEEAEIRRIVVQSQVGQIKIDPISKKPITKRAGGVAQGISPEFKPQYPPPKKKKKSPLFLENLKNTMFQLELREIKWGGKGEGKRRKRKRKRER